MLKQRAELLLEGQRLFCMAHPQTISTKTLDHRRKSIPDQEDFLERINCMELRDAVTQLLVLSLIHI